MAFTLRLPPEFQQRAVVVARKVHCTSLTGLIFRLIRAEIARARQDRPSLFESVPFEDLKPVDRTIYSHLTSEGRRTPDDLIAEMGLSRQTIKASLGRLIAAGYVTTLAQGQATPGQPGAQKLLYISLDEQ